MAGHERPHPIYSTLCEDPALQDAIDAFVVVLAERVDDLQDSESRADFGALDRRAEELAAESTKVGYDGLARCAAAVRAAARDGEAEAAHKAIVELTELAHRVRLGHRGAV